MGLLNVDAEFSPERLRAFTSNLLQDVRALEYMLENGMIESGVRRLGAEQELFIIDRACRPARTAMEILKHVNDEHFTTELASYNLEFNLDPIIFGSDCLSKMERQINDLLAKAKTAAQRCNSEILLIGILPTLRKSDVCLDSMTPKPRYHALNDALCRLRGADYELFLRGIDELYIKHDSVMLEACNTSFQVHFQVNPDQFVKYYNIAQAIAGPVLAVAVNSPLLFGKRLWRETRIAVFQQALDTRHPDYAMRESTPRVSFGNGWVRQSVLELFQEDIARFRVLMGVEIDENPFEALQQGRAPKLKALQIHNGTVYRWNRPCYGITDGKPHLRIENRVFPAGPTVIDEVANAAFWLGLINGMAAKYDDIATELSFDEVKNNFIAAARQGLMAQFSWLKNKLWPAQKLIAQQLLPLAREGLMECGIAESDIDRYLGTIKERVSCGQTGADWLLHSFTEIKRKTITSESLSALTEVAFSRQQEGKPVHEWPLAQALKRSDLQNHYKLVEQYMTTDILTVSQDDPIDLVLSVMNWRRIRHIPVEDNNNCLLGLVDYRSLIQLFQNGYQKSQAPIPVSAIMLKHVPTVTPTTTTLEAIVLMRQKGVTCLPVVQDNRLVGIVTQNDFMNIAAQFLEILKPEVEIQ